MTMLTMPFVAALRMLNLCGIAGNVNYLLTLCGSTDNVNHVFCGSTVSVNHAFCGSTGNVNHAFCGSTDNVNLTMPFVVALKILTMSLW